MVCRKCVLPGRGTKQFSGIVTIFGSIAFCKRCGALNVTGLGSYIVAIVAAIAICVIQPYWFAQKTGFGSGESHAHPQEVVPRSEPTDRQAPFVATPKAVIQDV